MPYRFVTFLSDFGLLDDFAGVCRGVIKRIAPDVEVIDVTHGIPAQQVTMGALVLANTVPYLPEGVHLAVVDPGVGSDRRALALSDASGRVYVGPDNGLLVPAAEGQGGIVSAHELTNPAYALEWVSSTFHGRDVFAPAAAHLALGVPPEELGPAIDPAGLVRLDLPVPEIAAGRILATVVSADSFGNVRLNVTLDDLRECDIGLGDQVELVLGTERYYATVARTFAEARAGDILLYEDAYRHVSVAISRGNAATLLGAAAGDLIRIHPR